MHDELTPALLHAVRQDEAYVVSGCDPLENHHHLRNLASLFIVCVVVALQVLAESVHDDELQVRKSLHDLLEFIAEK